MFFVEKAIVGFITFNANQQSVYISTILSFYDIIFADNFPPRCPSYYLNSSAYISDTETTEYFLKFLFLFESTILPDNTRNGK